MVPDQIVKREFVKAAELLSFYELVQIHLECGIRHYQRTKPRSVAFDTCGHIGESDTTEFERGRHPVEFIAEHTRQSAALCVGIAQFPQTVRPDKVCPRTNVFGLD